MREDNLVWPSKAQHHCTWRKVTQKAWGTLNGRMNEEAGIKYWLKIKKNHDISAKVNKMAERTSVKTLRS